MPINLKLATDTADIDAKRVEVVGRPTKCTQEMTDKICEIVAITSKGLGKIIQENPWMPDQATIRRWSAENVVFRDHFSRAKEEQIRKHLEYTVEIADEVVDTIGLEPHNSMKTGAYVQAAKLRTETREKYAQLLMPKVYGAKAVIDDKKEEESNLSEQERIAKVSGIFAGAFAAAKEAEENKK